MSEGGLQTYNTISGGSIFQQTGANLLLDEWAGQTSSKFRGNKKHLPDPEIKQGKHPLYEAEQKKHFTTRTSDSYQWKPCMKTVQGAVKPSACKDEWVPNNKPPRVFTEAQDRPEKRHLQAKESDTWDDPGIGLKTFVHIHNRKSVAEHNAEKQMGQKVRVQTMYEMRNGLPMASLGDKIYKAPEYQTGFFYDGGLIVGSTNQRKFGGGGNSKVIDFYAGIELGKGPLNPNRKLWKDAVREEQLNLELEAVGPGLKKWEKNVLKEVDPKYQVSDDSDDEGKKKK